MMKRLNLNLWEKVKTAFWSSDHEFNALLFLLLIFLLPTQFGRHFWFPFSYLHGLRLDYLAITLYTTDVLIGCLGISFLLRKRAELSQVFQKLLTHRISFRTHSYNTSLLLGFMLVFVLLNTLFSQAPWLTVYGWVKVGELSFFVFAVYTFCKTERGMILCVRAFLLGVFLQAMLALLQYHAGGSLGGFWYFLGERYFTGSTPGIANASIFGQLVLRPYGTLPHPNVLAAYLLVGLYFLLFTPSLFPKKLSSVLLSFLGVIFVISLVVTLSRTAIFLAVALFTLYLLSFLSKRKTMLLISGAILLFLFLFPVLLGRFGSIRLTEESVINREFYLQTSLEIIQRYPILGTGLFAYLPTVGKLFSVISYERLQPVHSVPFLLLAELGIPITLLLGLLCSYGTFLLWKAKRYSLLLLAFLLGGLGLVDHYFLTLQQGELLLGFCLAFLLSSGVEGAKQPKKSILLRADKRKI